MKNAPDGIRQSWAIAKQQTLSRRDQLSGLIRERDNIIHHASEITEEELSRGLKSVGAFIQKYGTDLIGLDILQ